MGNRVVAVLNWGIFALKENVFLRFITLLRSGNGGKTQNISDKYGLKLRNVAESMKVLRV